ncbi:MAG: glycosyltransferase family 2 protein [Bacteroidota bacterium]
MDKVSVIIPYYNAEKYIFKTLDSVLNQNYNNIEIILVDDGSIANTEEILHNYLDKLTYCRQENKGVSAARNIGLSICSGNFVVFFDADDIMPPDFISERVKVLKNNTDIDYVCSKMFYVDATEKPIATALLNGFSDNILNDILFYNKTIGTCPSNYLIRKDALAVKKISFNENLSSLADKFFMCELAYYFKGFQINDSKAYLHYRVHETNMSGAINYLKLIEETRKITIEYENAIFFKDNAELKRKVLKTNYIILAKSYFKVKDFKSSLNYVLKLLKVV